jgi:hypothetical protein
MKNVFPGDSRLSEIQEGAFGYSAFYAWIRIRSSVKMICEGCFSDSESLASVTLNRDSKLETRNGLEFQTQHFRILL